MQVNLKINLLRCVVNLKQTNLRTFLRPIEIIWSKSEFSGTRCISGVVNSLKLLQSFSPYNLKQTPGPVRPARPFRCSALARLIPNSCKRCILYLGSQLISLTLPESAINLNPSIVIEVSAMFVARIHFRTPIGAISKTFFI